ncbi:hypothetical protein BGX38DRAFT_573894 [Terfezia claveryi]|nr:hypothetical protein BGX38DRAFT_573894 [Terfezia claveryi]
MVTPKNLIRNSKADLGWDTRDADYTSWRNAVKDYCAQHSIRSWGAASQAEKDALVVAARGLTGFRQSIRDRLASGSEFHKKALEALLQDCLKKRSDIAKNLAIKRARKRVHADMVSDVDDEVSDGEIQGEAVAFWVGDPEVGAHRDVNGWIWDVRGRRKLGVIHLMTLDGIWDMVKTYVPPDRKVREIIGALEDPTPPNLTFPADYTSLNSDAEVRAFFRMTKAKPVRLLVLLHAVPPRANTPPARADPYFELDKFDPPNEYDDFTGDSDAIVRNAAGVGRRRMPTRDHTFEERNYELRGRVERRQEVKSEHKRLFPYF